MSAVINQRISHEVISSLATLTADLVRLRQREDSELDIEKYGAKVFGSLLDKYLEKQGRAQ